MLKVTDKAIAEFFGITNVGLSLWKNSSEVEYRRRYAAFKSMYIFEKGGKTETQIKAEELLSKVNEVLDSLAGKEVVAS